MVEVADQRPLAGGSLSTLCGSDPPLLPDGEQVCEVLAGRRPILQGTEGQGRGGQPGEASASSKPGTGRADETCSVC